MKRKFYLCERGDLFITDSDGKILWSPYKWPKDAIRAFTSQKKIELRGGLHALIAAAEQLDVAENALRGREPHGTV